MSSEAFHRELRAESVHLRTRGDTEFTPYETDFGGLVRGEAHGVVVPRSLAEVVQVVTLARSLGVSLTPRGMGLSQSGQSVANESVSLDLRELRRLDVRRLSERRVAVGPAVTFRELLAATMPQGLTPPVVPLNLDLSVGGVLSAGGMGSTTHRYGLVVDHVESLEVVLGTGETRRLNRATDRAIWDVVLGGVGRAAIITEATLELVSALDALRTTVLRYEHLDAMLADQARLAMHPAVEHLDAVCAPAHVGLARTPDGGRVPLRRFVFALHITVRADVPLALDDLHHAELLHSEIDDARAHAARFDARFRLMRASGAWDLAHPWFEAFVPAVRAREALELAMACPPFLAELIRVAPIAVDVHALRPRGLAMPEGPCVVVAMLPSGVPMSLVDAARTAIETLDDAYITLGAKRYLSGWLPRLHTRGYVEHHGALLEALASTVRRCDPDRILRSKLPPLTDER